MTLERRSLSRLLDSQSVGGARLCAARSRRAITRSHNASSLRLVGSARTLGTTDRFKVEYRLSGSLVIPYIKIPARSEFGPSPIKTILVCPCPHQEAVIAVTQKMCVQHQVYAEVMPSAISYRNWQCKINRFATQKLRSDDCFTEHIGDGLYRRNSVLPQSGRTCSRNPLPPRVTVPSMAEGNLDSTDQPLQSP